MSKKAPEELLQDGIRKIGEGDCVAAINDLNGVLETEPNNATAWFHKGLAQTLLRQLKEAVRSFGISLRLNRNQAIVWFSRGMARIKLKQFPEARDDLDTAIELDESNSHAWFYRSFVHAALEHHEKALADCQRCLELDPANALARFHSGLTKAKMGQVREAHSDFRLAADLCRESGHREGLEKAEEAMRELEREMLMEGAGNGRPSGSMH